LGTVGDDSVSGLGSDDFVAGDPDLFGPGGNDTVSGNGGDDQVWGQSGDNVVFGGAGNDDVGATTGSNVVYGDEGDDKVSGGYPFDVYSDAIFGGAGNDIMDAYNTVAVADIVSCGTGDDLAYVDESDIVSDDCEAVVIGPEPDPDDLLYLTVP
jgi:serralysin